MAPVGKMTDLSIEDIDEAQNWLLYAKVSIRTGIRSFAIPLWIAFIPIDYLCYPTIFRQALVVRLLGVALTLLVVRYLDKSASKAVFLRRYLLSVTMFSLAMTAIIAMTPDPTLHYFTGTCVIGIGTLSFVTLPAIYYWLTAAAAFVPFFILAILNGMAARYPQFFLLYLAIAGSFCLIFYFSHRYFSFLQAREYNLRKSLTKILSQKEKVLDSVVEELSRLRMQNRELQEKEETFRNARQLAHDLRSPLSALSSAILKLRESSPDIANLVESCNSRLSSITDEFLTDSKRKLSEAQVEPFLIGDAVREIVQEKQHLFGQKNISSDLQISADSEKVMVRLSDFSRALSNILDNSIDALPKGGNIHIALKRREPGFAQLEIRDNGRGIPPAIIPNIGSYGFTYGKQGGNGLGLAHAFAVVRAANGKIDINSDGRSFTHVKLLLPLALEGGMGTI